MQQLLLWYLPNCDFFISFIPSTFIHLKNSLLHIFIYSIIHLNMVSWTFYSMGYDLVPSWFILWLKLLFWLLGTLSSWLLCPFDIPHLFLNTCLFSVIIRYSIYTALASSLELTTYSRSLGSFHWRMILGSQDLGSQQNLYKICT